MKRTIFDDYNDAVREQLTRTRQGILTGSASEIESFVRSLVSLVAMRDAVHSQFGSIMSDKNDVA